eukprot:TRINITY_DN17792_c0_g1_i1.p1 TRINITY_DN17792_c0_g1~~TRINITY_DN17792_c0_g1_i1.p1  ORF type:complete len:298 (-),score=38.97 TRINITY_DN17792_c0_g1_i1:65-958(-)
MKFWLLSTIGTAIAALVILFLMSFDSLEYQEIGLNYSWISETVERRPYTSGRYYLGIGNHFIKFPRMVKSIFFIDDVEEGTHGPALRSRTKDGLNVRLEVSFQYRLKFDQVYDLYTILGATYEQTFVRMAIEQLASAATLHNAHFFFTNRTSVGQEMHTVLDKHFRKHGFAEVPFFQLRTVHLPTEFEAAIRETQVKQQDIQIASLEQKTKKVTFQTRVLQAEQEVKVMQNQAEAEAASIMAQNDAYCRQYKVTQNLQSGALGKLVETSGWDSTQLLEYMRIRAVRDHPSDKTMINL